MIQSIIFSDPKWYFESLTFQDFLLKTQGVSGNNKASDTLSEAEKQDDPIEDKGHRNLTLCDPYSIKCLYQRPYPSGYKTLQSKAGHFQTYLKKEVKQLNPVRASLFLRSCFLCCRFSCWLGCRFFRGWLLCC